MDQTPSEKTALEWLSEQFPESPRTRLKQWFSAGRVRLDGLVLRKPHTRMADPGERLSLGDVAEHASFSRSMPTRIHAQLNLLYIDSSLAIVNKGCGLLSVPLPDSPQNSALDVLRAYLADKGSDAAGPRQSRRSELFPLPVHRLDQYTSGLLCFAMNPEAREKLVGQVRDHSFIREYLALAEGPLEPARGNWRSWFRQREDGSQEVRDEPFEGAVEARSSYEVVATYRWSGPDRKERRIHKLRLRLRSGLRHQLRIHAATAGAPLLGDRQCHPDYAADRKPSIPCNRQALHASNIGFIHPGTGRMKRFKSKFPRDLAALEAQLQARGR